MRFTRKKQIYHLIIYKTTNFSRSQNVHLMSVIEARKGECDYEISAEKVSGYPRGILHAVYAGSGYGVCGEYDRYRKRLLDDFQV